MLRRLIVPFGLKDPELNLGSRIMVISDIFCALLENRPYREGMTYSQATGILKDMVRDKKLNAKIVNNLINNIDVNCALIKTNIFDNTNLHKQ